ncbi:amidohydrolase/deacetylase family metallohydrolase [Pleomorphovibrio marinus]|uniref:amidohydrolase/deacetylase family metallohydrolase n=1 Tax=Pleomorphovibrio marinus TaxID=2164132 RepID=UPI000E0A67FF|nr:amidohydrolase/deacetylase family metallohydrolase [Pleomorphovibrio marinus]
MKEPRSKLNLNIFLSLFFAGILLSSPCVCQTFDLLIKNGHLLDAKNNINKSMDIGIRQGKVALVSESISSSKSKVVVDAKGLFITPGLIDPHTHVYVGENPRVFAAGSSSVYPDSFTFRSGVTTVVDAGTSGWRNFEDFKAKVIDLSQTRVLAFLNISGGGMQGNPSQEDLEDMDPMATSKMIKNYSEYIVGVKIGHYEGEDWTPFERAIEAAELATLPLLVECHLPNYSLADQLERMRPGDILSHTFENVKDREPIIDTEGKLLPEVIQAREKGILFDVSHGGAGFWFNQAIPAMKQGLKPDTFGTDLHRFSMNAGMKNFSNVLSKFMAMNMSLEEVISKASWGTALAIGREDLGHLSEGAVADIALFRLREGEFGFVDAGGEKITGKNMLEAEMTIREGRIVYDLNGLSARPFKTD